MMMRKYEYCLIHVHCVYQLIHTKEEKKFGWMEMGIVVKIHVPIQVKVKNTDMCKDTTRNMDMDIDKILGSLISYVGTRGK